MAEEIKTSTPPTNTSAPSSTSSSSGSGSSGGGATKVIIIVVVVLAVLGVAGYLTSRYFAQKIGEKAAEGLIGAATGAKVDVSGSKVTIKDSSSNLEIGTSSWPSTMPASVTQPKDGKINYSASDNTNKTWSVGYENVSATAYNTYKSTLTTAGWTVSSETDLGSGKLATFTKGDLTISYTLDVDNSGATLTVTQQ